MGFKSTDFPSSRSAEAVQTTPKQMAKPAIRLEGPGRVAESVDCWPFGELGKSGVGGFSTARLDDQSAKLSKFAKDFFGKIQFVKSHQLEPEESVLRKIWLYSSPWIFVGDLNLVRPSTQAQSRGLEAKVPVTSAGRAASWTVDPMESCFCSEFQRSNMQKNQKRMLKDAEI
jgi:hypothetical protein